MFWYHSRFLEETESGIEMTDIVHYKILFGFLGVLLINLLVKKQLKYIFDFRFSKSEEIFNHFL